MINCDVYSVAYGSSRGSITVFDTVIGCQKYTIPAPLHIHTLARAGNESDVEKGSEGILSEAVANSLCSSDHPLW